MYIYSERAVETFVCSTALSLLVFLGGRLLAAFFGSTLMTGLVFLLVFAVLLAVLHFGYLLCLGLCPCVALCF